MTKLKIVLLSLAVLYGGGAAPVHAGPAMPKPLMAEKAAKTVPNLAFTDLKGRHSLQDFRGKYLLVNMWATWCAPCVAELPALTRLQAAAPNITVLAMDLTGKAETPAKAAAFLKKHNASALGSFVDTERVFMRSFTAAVMPTTVLIDPNGRVIARAEGPAEWASPVFVNYFKSLN
jgi:thiol-disulfide isomerase/thioredoxin